MLKFFYHAGEGFLLDIEGGCGGCVNRQGSGFRSAQPFIAPPAGQPPESYFMLLEGICQLKNQPL
jgi:hypothetical protein